MENNRDGLAFEEFARNRGYKYKTDEELNLAFDRYVKVNHGELLSKEEYLTELGLDNEPAKEVYDRLVRLYEEHKLTPGDIYRYAFYRWCSQNADAITAYLTACNRCIVNDCDTEISEMEAIAKVNLEWGFEADRIKIIETPYYDATDWQFIRFNCAGCQWLWAQDALYPVYQ